MEILFGILISISLLFICRMLYIIFNSLDSIEKSINLMGNDRLENILEYIGREIKDIKDTFEGIERKITDIKDK